MPARHPLSDPPVQVVTIDATGGTFTLSYSGQVTDPLAADVCAADVRVALERLDRIGAGSVAVDGPDGGPFELRFGGGLVGRDIAVVEADGSELDGTADVTTQVPSPWE